MEKIAADLLLEDKSKQERLAAVRHYFLTGYAYSLELQGKGNHDTPLQNFLYHTRAGHCEFFATATVLLLRQAGIPARYVTGYVAHEYSRMGAHLVVRQRDAHAWAKAYINGRWRVVDNTPPSFVQADSQIIKTSPAADLVAFLGFKLSQLRHETGAKWMRQYGLWLCLPLGLIFFSRLKKTKQIKRARMTDRVQAGSNHKIHKTAFDLVEETLSQQGFVRYPYETYVSWLERIEPLSDNRPIFRSLGSLLVLHNKQRFSQSGLDPKEKRKLEAGVKKIMASLSARQ